jgi:hypothetical protein
MPDIILDQALTLPVLQSFPPSVKGFLDLSLPESGTSMARASQAHQKAGNQRAWKMA